MNPWGWTEEEEEAWLEMLTEEGERLIEDERLGWEYLAAEYEQTLEYRVAVGLE